MKNTLILIGKYRDKLEVTPNYENEHDDSWDNSIGKADPFFIGFSEGGRGGDVACIGLTIEQATELRDFLSEKIDYLTQK